MREGTRRLAILLAICLGISTLACGSTVNTAVNKAVDKAANKTAERVGEKVGEKVGDVVAGQLLANLTPALMQTYSVAVFQMLFYHGGVHVSGVDYQPGQYTRWQAEGIEQGEWFERALLRRHEGDSEWWRVESRGKDDKGAEKILIMEALLSAPRENGSRQIRRMRAKFPDESEAREIPITEESSSTWVVTSSQQLTPESLEGMTQGEEQVTVPAGTFQTQHIRMDHYQRGHLHWFMTEKVPGQVVKYRRVETKSQPSSAEAGDETPSESETTEEIWELVLLAFGEGETESKLGVDLSKTPVEPAAEGEEGAGEGKT